MARKKSNRQRLETLQASRTMTIDEIASVNDQISGLEQRKEQLEAALDDPEQTITAGAAADLGDILSQLASLARVRSSLETRKISQDEAIRETLATVNHAAVLAARPGERERFEAVINAARALWSAIAEYDQFLQESIYPHHARALCGVPADLIAWVKPGWHGGFRHWANTDRIGGGPPAAD